MKRDEFVLEALANTAEDSRAIARSNVFLSAALVWEETSRAVRVRNISENGALLDGSGLPREGVCICLRRGNLEAKGEIAWRGESQCGVRFDASIDVTQWLKRIEHSGQSNVDRMVAHLRQSPEHGPDEICRGAPSSDSLDELSSELASLCERLASSPRVVADHSVELLALDAISQRLKKLAGTNNQKEQ